MFLWKMIFHIWILHKLMVRQIVLLSRHQIGNFQPSAAVDDGNMSQWIIRGSRQSVTYTRHGRGSVVVPVASSGVESRRRMPQTRLTRPMDTGLAQASNETSWRHKKKRRGVRESRVRDAVRTCPCRSHTLRCCSKVQVQVQASGSLQECLSIPCIRFLLFCLFVCFYFYRINVKCPVCLLSCWEEWGDKTPLVCHLACQLQSVTAPVLTWFFNFHTKTRVIKPSLTSCTSASPHRLDVTLTHSVTVLEHDYCTIRPSHFIYCIFYFIYIF